MDYFTPDTLKNIIFNIYIYGLAYVNKLGNQYASHNRVTSVAGC